MKKSFLRIAALSAISSAVLTSFSSYATIVEFDIAYGSESGKVQVNLYDETTPTTVANFLSYVTNGSYDGTIIHRNATKLGLDDNGSQIVKNFYLQGGAFYFDSELPLSTKTTNSAIRNEPVWSNVSGTIAMSKTDHPDAATRQWFFNMDDNSSSLDIRQNIGGFSVFGQVISGFDVLQAIADGNNCPSNGVQDLPFILDTDKTCQQYVSGETSDPDLVQYKASNFVTVNSITITNSATDTSAEFIVDPTLNSLLDTDNDGEVNINDTDDDGDGTSDENDLYPFDASESKDSDGDGVGDNTDVFPNDETETVDSDEDGTGDNADLDDDNDGVNDTEDAFPYNASEQFDSDGDGVGDNTDEFINDASEWRDLDKDGVGDNADKCPTIFFAIADDNFDNDNDGYCNVRDAFPDDASEYLDTDGDGIGDNTDPDKDGDGALNDDDYAPLDPDITEQPVYSSGGGGGSLSIFALFALGLISRLRKLTK